MTIAPLYTISTDTTGKQSTNPPNSYNWKTCEDSVAVFHFSSILMCCVSLPAGTHEICTMRYYFAPFSYPVFHLSQITAECSAGKAWRPQMCLVYKETSLGYLGRPCLKWRLYANTQTASAVNTFIIQERVCAVVCCQWCLSNTERAVRRDAVSEEVRRALKRLPFRNTGGTGFYF